MLECFQNIFCNPTDKAALEYTGTTKNGQWDNGILKSSDNEWQVVSGIPDFRSDKEGDQFDQQDIDSWTKGGRFHRRWTSKDNLIQSTNDVYYMFCQKAAALNLPIMEVACGPGLGLLPDILAINPETKCLATDACSSVIKSWHKFFMDNHVTANISFASFDATNMPICSNTVDVITSNIGFSSLRYAGVDGLMGVNEAYRVLKPGGYVFAVENAWKDRAAIHEVFKLWGRDYWFNDSEMNWHDKFEKANFKILEEKHLHSRALTAKDNDLGEAASKFGIEIGLEFTAYILQKV